MWWLSLTSNVWEFVSVLMMISTKGVNFYKILYIPELVVFTKSQNFIHSSCKLIERPLNVFSFVKWGYRILTTALPSDIEVLVLPSFGGNCI